MQMKLNQTLHSNARRIILVLAFGIFATLPLHSLLADDSIQVTIHRYDGESGHDQHGDHTYRAKVHHGHHYYYVYMHSALPELAKHMHDKTPVAVNSSGHWLSISIDGTSAKIYKVVKIGHSN